MWIQINNLSKCSSPGQGQVAIKTSTGRNSFKIFFTPLATLSVNMVRPEETYPHNRPDKWRVTTSEQALIYVCERWNDSQEEAKYDVECLEKYTKLVESVATDLMKQGKTKETSGPDDRNKLPLDQYDRLKKTERWSWQRYMGGWGMTTDTRSGTSAGAS